MTISHQWELNSTACGVLNSLGMVCLADDPQELAVAESSLDRGYGLQFGFVGKPMFSQLRKRENVRALAVEARDLGSRLHEAGKRGEELADFTGMLKAVTIVLSVAFVAHHLGQTERAQYIAHACHASADRPSDLAGS